MEARAQWDFLFFQDRVLCRRWETESDYRLTYQIVHWAECNPVGPSPDVGVGGTTACGGIILRVYYYITVLVVVVVFVLLCEIKPKNLLKQGPPHKLCDRCNIRRFFCLSV